MTPRAALAGLAAAMLVPAEADAPRTWVVRPVEPPEQGFYAKVIDCDGIPVKASSAVSDAAMQEAARRIARLLRSLPQVRRNLVAAGAEHHIIGKDQETSDLPEWRHMKGRPHWDGSPSFDGRVRGMGGLISSSGEENLLKLPSDRYRDHRDICSHEFSHGIFSDGIPREIRDRFEEQRRKSVAKGLWKSYARTNADEFFAELTMWYFGTRGDFGAIKPAPRAGRAWLREYDPEAFRLFDDFYRGRIPVAAVTPGDERWR
jgi:alpha-glucosidase